MPAENQPEAYIDRQRIGQGACNRVIFTTEREHTLRAQENVIVVGVVRGHYLHRCLWLAPISNGQAAGKPYRSPRY